MSKQTGGIDNSAWEENTAIMQAQVGDRKETEYTIPSYGNEIYSLLDSPSMMSDGRNTVVSDKVAEILRTAVKKRKETTQERSRDLILPEVVSLDASESPRIPGIVLTTKIANTILMMPVFIFSRKHTIKDFEEVIINNTSLLTQGMPQRADTPVPPVKQVNGALLNHIKQNLVAKDGGNVKCEIVAGLVVDLDQIIDLPKDDLALETHVADNVLREWEKSILLTVTTSAIRAQRQLPSPFFDAGNKTTNKPYGPSDTARVNAEAMMTPMFINGQPQGSNLLVRMQTTNSKNNSQSQQNQREIVTAVANVHLVGVPLATYQPPKDQGNYIAMMQNAMTGENYPMGYRPLQAVVTLDGSIAGAQMGMRDGIQSTLMSLFALLTTNNNYMWSEPLRHVSPFRGSLADMEVRIDEMIGNNPQFSQYRTKEKRMTEAKLADMDFTSNWIRRNIAPNAAFAIDLSELSNDAALANLLMGLCTKEKASSNMKVIIGAGINTFGPAFSDIIARNKADGKGWCGETPILVRSPILIPHGTIQFGDKTINLSEIDEMSLSKLNPTDRTLMNRYLQAQYGDNNQTDEAVRRYALNLGLGGLNGNEAKVTNIGYRYFLTPDFMQVIAEVGDKIGNLQVSGTMGLYNNSLAVFSPSSMYATAAAAGAAGAYSTPQGVFGNPSVFSWSGN